MNTTLNLLLSTSRNYLPAGIGRHGWQVDSQVKKINNFQFGRECDFERCPSTNIKNNIHMATVPIFADALTHDELEQAIKQYINTEITLTFIENPDKFRSPLSDPTVLAAIIAVGGAVVSALIGAFALIYASRKNKGETEAQGSVIININVTSDKLPESQIVIPLDNLKLEEYKAKVDELELRPEIIENINYSEEP